MSYDQLGNMDCEIVERLWESWKIRQALEQIESNRRELIMSLRANGMIDGDGMKKEMESIKEGYDEARAHVLGTRHNVEDGEYLPDTDSPFMQAGR